MCTFLPGDVVTAPQVLDWLTAIRWQPCVRFVDHARGVSASGPAALATLVALFDDAFGTAACTLTAVSDTEETRLVALQLNGRPQRPFWGLPAVDCAVSLPLALVGQGAAAGLHTLDCYYDAGTLLRQMGLALLPR